MAIKSIHVHVASPAEYRFTIRVVDGTSHGVYTKRVEAKNSDEAWALVIKDLKTSGVLQDVMSITKG